MAATSALQLAGSAVATAGPANQLSSSAAFGSSRVQRLGAVRPAAKASCKVGGARASVNDEERSVAAKPQMLVAIVAAGAALALNAAAPTPPASAGLFGSDTKAERNSSSLLGSEGTGNKVGNNSGTRGEVSSGTEFGEGAGNKIGENSASRGSASTGTPFGEGGRSGSGGFSAPDLGSATQKAKDSVQGATAGADPLKNIGSLNLFKSGGTASAPDVGAGAQKAKNSVQGATASADPLKNIGDLNPFKSGGVPDVAGEAKKNVGGLVGGFPNADRGASSNFPSNEGVGNQVGNNSDVRGLAGTPLGEGAGNSVGDNSATRTSSSTGTPLGEGNLSGSGVNVGELLQGAPDVGAAAEKAKSSLQGSAPSFDPLKSTIGSVKGGTPDVAGAAANAKQNVLGALKSKLPGGN